MIPTDEKKPSKVMIENFAVERNISQQTKQNETKIKFTLTHDLTNQNNKNASKLFAKLTPYLIGDVSGNERKDRLVENYAVPSKDLTAVLSDPAFQAEVDWENSEFKEFINKLNNKPGISGWDIFSYVMGAIGGLAGIAAVASVPLILLGITPFLATPPGLAIVGLLGLIAVIGVAAAIWYRQQTPRETYKVPSGVEFAKEHLTKQEQKQKQSLMQIAQKVVNNDEVVEETKALLKQRQFTVDEIQTALETAGPHINSTLQDLKQNPSDDNARQNVDRFMEFSKLLFEHAKNVKPIQLDNQYKLAETLLKESQRNQSIENNIKFAEDILKNLDQKGRPDLQNLVKEWKSDAIREALNSNQYSEDEITDAFDVAREALYSSGQKSNEDFQKVAQVLLEYGANLRWDKTGEAYLDEAVGEQVSNAVDYYIQEMKKKNDIPIKMPVLNDQAQTDSNQNRRGTLKRTKQSFRSLKSNFEGYDELMKNFDELKKKDKQGDTGKVHENKATSSTEQISRQYVNDLEQKIKKHDQTEVISKIKNFFSSEKEEEVIKSEIKEILEDLIREHQDIGVEKLRSSFEGQQQETVLALHKEAEEKINSERQLQYQRPIGLNTDAPKGKQKEELKQETELKSSTPDLKSGNPVSNQKG